MDILLYGTTELGYLIASRLHQRHNITVLYENGELPEKFGALDISSVEGSGGDIEALERCGARGEGMFIACSALDEANIVACWTLKKVSDRETICFVSKPELYRNLSTTSHDRYHTRYDIDSIIWPELLLTHDIFRVVSVPNAIDVEYLAGGKAKLFEYRISAGSIIADKPVRECRFPANVLIAGITRDSRLFIPDGDTVIRADDKVFFIGSGPGLDNLAADFFQSGNRVSRISIIGGGNVGFMLAQRFERRNLKVKLIEHDPERCEFLANSLKKTLVLLGDGTDLELLESEAIADADVCVCITDNDEKNLLCSLLVKQLGSRRTVTRVGNLQNYELFGRVGIDVVVSPKASALTEVLNRVQEKAVDIIALIEGGKGEVLRVTLPEKFKEVRLRQLKSPVGAVIGVIQRGHQVLIPNGETSLLAGDELKIFTMKEDSDRLKEFFLS